jgi:5-methylcytosine-specific restriction endonuclease McrA
LPVLRPVTETSLPPFVFLVNRERTTEAKMLGSLRAYARHRGVALFAVQKAIQTGRITRTVDGLVDFERADAAWVLPPPKACVKPGQMPPTEAAPERSWMYQSEFARSIRKTSISRYIRSGMPLLDGGLIEPVSARAWIEEFERAEAGKRESQRTCERASFAILSSLEMQNGRECRACGKHLPPEMFNRYRSQATNTERLRSICKPCHKEKYEAIYKARLRVEVAAEKLTRGRKVCNRCEVKKPEAAFKHGDRACLECRVILLEAEVASLSERAKFADAKDWQRERARRDKHAHPEKSLKWNEKRAKLMIEQSDGTVTAECLGDLFASAEGKPCPYCGVQMLRGIKSLDHMEPLSLGGAHSLGNLIICCRLCNTRKRNWPLERWLEKISGRVSDPAGVVEEQCLQ